MENEFYGTIRPKRRIRPGERPLHALRQRGVEYVEVRLMDLDPFEPVGIGTATMRMLDVYLLYCLLSPSPPDTAQELSAIIRNKQLVASRGREPGLLLSRRTGEATLGDWGAEVLSGCEPIAAALDAANGVSAHREALANASARLRNPALTPSARALQTVEREYGNSFVRFVLAQSIRHRETIGNLPLSADVVERYARLARESLVKQREIEASDTLPFDAYLRQYLSPERLNV